MRKTLFLLFIVAWPMLAMAGARVFNTTNEKILISLGADELVINPRSAAYAWFLPDDGIAEFKLSRYEGFNAVLIGQVKRKVTRGKIAIKDFSLTDYSEPEEKKTEKSKDSEKKAVTTTSYPVNTGGWWSSVDITPKNESDYRFTVLANPFRGLALASGQASSRSANIQTGPLTFPVYFDPEEDETSTGRKYRWAVVSKIVAEGQDTLRITNNDLKNISTGEEIKKAVKNNLPIDFYIVDGPNLGIVIPADRMVQLDLMVGWNVVPVQYKDEQGRPTQAVLLLMINNLKHRPLIADKKSDSGTSSIDPDNLVLIGR